MIALDTNIIVRLLTNDDPRQVSKARAELNRISNANEQAFISNLVLLETVWVLEAGYKISRINILKAIESLTMVPVFKFKDIDVIHKFTQTGKASTIDLSDILIGLDAQSSGCQATLTFDKAAARHSLFKKL